MHYRSIFVSDVHLGSKDAKAQELENFLKLNTCECLYLVGDIIDGWKAQKNKLRWKNSHTGLLRHILKLSKNTKVIYLTGNHDEFLRVAVPYSIILGNIELHDQYEHVAVDGKKYLVVHGDLFDGITKLHHGYRFWETKDTILFLLLTANITGSVTDWGLVIGRSLSS